MNDWWNDLTMVNRVFYGAAMFFGILFVWQLISAFMGLDADTDADTPDTGDADIDHSHGDYHHGADSDSNETVMTFKLLSVRSIITFFTLFTWGSALYLNRGDAPGRAMGMSCIWGLAGMLSVALFFWLLPRLAHTGTKQIGSAVGTNGSVYLDIPNGGTGEVKILVSGVMSHVGARSADGKAVKAGTPVRVTGQLDDRTVEVERISNDAKGDVQ